MRQSSAAFSSAMGNTRSTKLDLGYFPQIIRNNSRPILLKDVMDSQPQNIRPLHAPEQEYLEIELDAAAMEQVEALATEANLTPFGICVTLLREGMAAR
ncbi:MAG: hypothetical protein JWQ04_103 [Pedosphaera sp.]|nr:hypothetical protein [Pedosphaera sp.]